MRIDGGLTILMTDMGKVTEDKMNEMSKQIFAEKPTRTE